MIASCGGGGKSTAEAAVRDFHAKLDAGRYGQIYEDADLRLHHDLHQDEFVLFLANIHQELGRVTRADEVRVQFWTGEGLGPVTYLEVVYQTTFEKGYGTEAFNWVIADNHARLVLYDINSDSIFKP